MNTSYSLNSVSQIYFEIEGISKNRMFEFLRFNCTHHMQSKDSDLKWLMYAHDRLIQVFTAFKINVILLVLSYMQAYTKDFNNIWALMRENLSFGFATKNHTVQLQRLARIVKFHM